MKEEKPKKKCTLKKVLDINKYELQMDDARPIQHPIKNTYADKKSGEVVKVFAVKKCDTLTEEELIGFCKENLTGYKVPKTVEFRAELPKSNVGKILRKDLRG